MNASTKPRIPSCLAVLIEFQDIGSHIEDSLPPKSEQRMAEQRIPSVLTKTHMAVVGTLTSLLAPGCGSTLSWGAGIEDRERLLR